MDMRPPAAHKRLSATAICDITRYHSLKIALVLVRCDHVASLIVNADRRSM
jgi:hypothetical protein